MLICIFICRLYNNLFPVQFITPAQVFRLDRTYSLPPSRVMVFFQWSRLRIFPPFGKCFKIFVFPPKNVLGISLCLKSLTHNDDFWRTRGKSHIKTLWEKKKMLVTSIFFFSHNVFYPVKVTFNLSSANAYSLGKLKILSSGKGLILLQPNPNCYDWTNKFHFVHFAMDAISYPFFQTSHDFYGSAVQIFWKHCGKRRNCS